MPERNKGRLPVELRKGQQPQRAGGSSVDTKDSGTEDQWLGRLEKMGCPFYKYDPIKFHSCVTARYDSIARLRQHIARAHNQFELSRSAGRSGDRREKWYGIWDALFPGVPQPASPYVNDVVTELTQVVFSKWLEDQNSRNIGVMSHGPGDLSPDPVRSTMEKFLKSISQNTTSVPPVSGLQALLDTSKPSEQVPHSSNGAYSSVSSGNQFTSSSRREKVWPHLSLGPSPEASGVSYWESAGQNLYTDNPSTNITESGDITNRFGYPRENQPTGTHDFLSISEGAHFTSNDPSGSRGDSGYGSYKAITAQKVRDEKDIDGASVYSTESTTGEQREAYISAFSSHLVQDICKNDLLPNLPSDFGKPLFELLRLFTIKLRQESLTEAHRAASVFLRQYRG